MITMVTKIDESFLSVVELVKKAELGMPISTQFPNAFASVRKAAEMVRDQWKAYAAGEQLPDGKRIHRPTSGPGSYYNSITMVDESSSWNWNFRVSSSSPIAGIIEHGTNGYDMKLTHPYGEKGRVAEKRIPKRLGGGIRRVPYVIVPFQWETPNAGAHVGPKNIIPKQIYNRMITGRDKSGSEKFKRTFVLDEKTHSPNFWGDIQDRSVYKWGSRLDAMGILGLEESEKTGIPFIHGLTRHGEKGNTSYWTFRVISADSPEGSWINKGIKPIKVAEQTANAKREEVRNMIHDGFVEDLKIAGQA